MPLIDERGRLFGRFNIIDAALVAVLLILLPIAYTAVRLFRVPSPQIASVEPPSQPAGPSRRIRVHGRDFRPYLRAFVTPTGQPFSLLNRLPDSNEGIVRLETPMVIEVSLPSLAPGPYDLYLFDETQEVGHLLHAFELADARPPRTVAKARMQASVPAEVARLMRAGDTDVSLSDNAQATPPADRLPPARVTNVRMLDRRGAGPVAYPGIVAALQDAVRIEADVDIPVMLGADGVWRYGRQAVRSGDLFTFQTRNYFMGGLIGDVSIDSVPPADDRSR
jgi:uncharacterized protein DUF4330